MDRIQMNVILAHLVHIFSLKLILAFMGVVKVNFIMHMNKIVILVSHLVERVQLKIFAPAGIKKLFSF